MIEKKSVSVSIIVPNYNNGKYLVEFIQSVLDSTILPRELIIIDDGSTDESVSILDAFKELSFLKVICFNQNRGLTEALNVGLDLASEKYIMRADPDDLLHRDRIERQFQFMEDNPEIDVLGSNVYYFNDKHGNRLNTSTFPLHDKAIKKAYMQGEHGLMHATVITKSSVFKQYHYQKIFPGEDFEIFARMVLDNRTFANLRTPLYLVRVHPSSTSNKIIYQTIQQTFTFRDQIFGTKTSSLSIYLYYQHIRHYRLFLSYGLGLFGFFHLIISVVCYPLKVFKRLQV